MGYFDQSQSSVAAVYEYGPFGQVLKAVGNKADQFTFGFSTKYQDDETGLSYYGFRYYAPDAGRWLSRDPAEEEGGINLYGFVDNDAINDLDYLGLRMVTLRFEGFIPNTIGRSVTGSPVPGVNWQGEPDPLSTFWFSTDNRAGKGSKGTSSGKLHRVFKGNFIDTRAVNYTGYLKEISLTRCGVAVPRRRLRRTRHPQHLAGRRQTASWR